ncbi:hypothetical protein V8G54_020627 [Vigna mungo]|uniref:Uncharacterized protein n=1 Tax=Vigna mungo TaxID=3915 RepID=A0AAQ3NDZ7_VIGMU
MIDITSIEMNYQLNTLTQVKHPIPLQKIYSLAQQKSHLFLCSEFVVLMANPTHSLTIDTFNYTYKQMKTQNISVIYVYGSKRDIWNISKNLVNYVALKTKSS